MNFTSKQHDGGVMKDERIDPLDPRELQSILEVRIARPRHGHKFKMSVEPGVYTLYDSLQEGAIPRLKTLECNADNLVEMTGGAYDALHESSERFFAARDQYARDGLLHKRGIILHGPPGSGKSTMLREAAERHAAAGRVVFYAYDPGTVSTSLKTFRGLDSRRDVVVIMEDVDEMLKYGGTHRMLEMTDGVDSPEHVLFIATANDLAALPAKLRRKGRFEEKIAAPMPDVRQRFAYVRSFSGLTESEARQIAKGTKGAGFGTLKDTVSLILAYGSSIEEAVGEAKREVLAEAEEKAAASRRGQRNVYGGVIGSDGEDY